MEQTQRRKKKKVYTKQIAALVFLGLLIVMSLLNLILGNKKAVKPKMTIEAVLDGKYMEEYADYFADRFMGKGAFAGLDFSVQTLFGKRESGGIYRGKGKYLLERIAEPDEKAIEENIGKIQDLAGTYYNIPVYFMLVPNAANIQSEKLPAYAVGRDQKKQFDDIRERLGTAVNWVDVSKALEKHGDEEIYYRTDKNWTSLGAFYGYETLAAAMELDTSKAPALTPYVVNNDYIGSLARQSGYGKGYEDSITIYAPKNIKNSVRLIMTNMDTDKSYATLYDSTKLEKEDKYSLFLGKDAGMIDIKTTAETTDRLLIFKDSYANCLIPFLTPYYREIVVIDPSLYEGNVQEIMQKAKFTSILFLYSGNSFVTDTNLLKVLGMTDVSGTRGSTSDSALGAQDEGEEGASASQSEESGADDNSDSSDETSDGNSDSDRSSDDTDEDSEEDSSGSEEESSGLEEDTSSSEEDSSDSGGEGTDSQDRETDDATE